VGPGQVAPALRADLDPGRLESGEGLAIVVHPVDSLAESLDDAQLRFERVVFPQPGVEPHGVFRFGRPDPR
jgi:hypothetical protein